MMSSLSPESQAPREALDPSLPLRDRRREAFARALYEGCEENEAYEQAGFRRPRGNAFRMAREPEIIERVNWLRRRLDETDLALRTYRRHELRRRLTAIATLDRTEMFEEVEIERTIGRGKKAVKVKSRFLQPKPLSALSEAHRQLFEGLGDGGRMLFPAKLVAEAQLARLDGLDAPAKVAATDPSGQHGAPLQIVEIVRFAPDGDATDQAAA